MSQSSETTTSSFDLLGYKDSAYGNGYYTAQARPGIGVCVASMSGGTMVQFFPWGAIGHHGHEFYARFITDKASALMAEIGELFIKWPFMHTESSELLIIKCLIEDGLNQVEKMNELQPSSADATAGKALE